MRDQSCIDTGFNHGEDKGVNHVLDTWVNLGEYSGNQSYIGDLDQSEVRTLSVFIGISTGH